MAGRQRDEVCSDSEFLEVSRDGKHERWSQKIRYIEPLKKACKGQGTIHTRSQSSCMTQVNRGKGNNADRKPWSQGRHTWPNNDHLRKSGTVCLPGEFRVLCLFQLEVREMRC